MKKKNPSLRTPVRFKKSSLHKRWDKIMGWIKEPFEELSRLSMMMPQAKLSVRMAIAEKREMAALHSPR